MKVKGINKLYDVEVMKIRMSDGQNGIKVTAGNMNTGMTSVVISEENWEKLKEMENENKNTIRR